MKSFKRNLKDKESREYWKFVDKCTREVLKWPEWKRRIAENILQLQRHSPKRPK